MRGKRAPRGKDRAGKIEGVNYEGVPTAVVASWGGGAIGATAPSLGSFPTITIPIDANDDGSNALDVVKQSKNPARKSTRDTTKARHRTQLKTLANWIALLSQKATGTDRDFSFSDDFVGAVVDTSKWIITGTSADATIIADDANGGFGAVQLNPTSNGDSVALNTRALAVGTKDFICAMRFRFGAALDSTKAAFLLGMNGAFWLESNAASSDVFFRYDGGGVFPANTIGTGLLVTDAAYHEVQIKRLLGVLYLVVDGVIVTSFADSFSGDPPLLIETVDTTAAADLIVDYVKLWVAR